MFSPNPTRKKEGKSDFSCFLLLESKILITFASKYA
jgi:hypothetical protein